MSDRTVSRHCVSADFRRYASDSDTDTLANYLNGRFLAEDVSEKLSGMSNSIRDWQNKNPVDGVLVSVNFARTELTPDPLGVMKNRLLIHPGDHLEDIELFFGSTPEEAAKQLRERRYIVQSSDVYQTARSRAVYWVSPRVKAMPLQSPVGRWSVKVGRFAFLYDFSSGGGVKWTDSFNGNTGQGKWKILGDKLTFDWPSKTIEVWNLPFSTTNQTGSCLMGIDGSQVLKAVKL